MKVLQFGMSSIHGGVESFILNYAGYLVNFGVIFDYVDLHGEGLVYQEQLVRSGSTVYTIPDHRKHPVAAYRKIRKIISDGGYSCVHINMLSAASLIPVLASLRERTRVIVHSHNSKTVGLHRKILHALNVGYLRRMDLTRLACSKYAGKWMFGDRTFKIIPNAIDSSKFKFNIDARQKKRNEIGVDENTLVLGFVGRLFAQKNPLYLANILLAIKNRTNEKVKLLIVGDGILREKLHTVACELGVADDIIFVGRQTDTADWYSAMDAFVLPSFWEGLPLVGIEAQAAGLQCFISDQITDELVVTDLVHFCELTEDAANWADNILSNLHNQTKRHQYASEVEQSIFSLTKSGTEMYVMYCGTDTKLEAESK